MTDLERTPELDDRARRALGAYADAVPVRPDLHAVIARARAQQQSPARPRAAHRFAPLLAAAVVVTLIAGVTVLPRLLWAPSPSVTPSVSGPPVLPGTLPDRSLFTASVSRAPAGPALALYAYTEPVKFTDFPQAVMLSRDGRSTRRVDLAEDRGDNPPWPFPGFDLAPILLSPDGTSVAVGDQRASAKASLAIVELSTGDTRTIAVSPNRRVEPLAWSPDLRRIAYVDTAADGIDYGPRRRPGKIVLLDLRTGAKTTVPGVRAPSAAAWSPDSTQLAVQDGEHLKIIDPDGRTVRDLTPGKFVGLSGSAAWSPDGAWLAVLLQPDKAGDEADYELRFLDPTGAGRQPPKPTPLVGITDIVGWRSPDALLLFDRDELTLDERTLTGGHRTLAAFDPSQRNAAQPHSFQLASNLLPELRVEETGDLDRGPWPWWVWVGAVPVTTHALGLVFFLLAVLLRPLGKRRRQLRASA